MQSVEIQITDLVFLIISWSIILFGILLSGVLYFQKKGKDYPRSILAILLLVSSFFLVYKLVGLVGLASQFWGLYVLPLNYTLSIPPLVYFYVKFKLQPASGFRKQDVLHFTLPIIQALFYIIVGFSNLSLKTKLWRNGTLSMVYTVEDITLFSLALGYIIAAYRLLSHSKKLWQQRSGSTLVPDLITVLLLIVIAHLSFNLLGLFYQANFLTYTNYFLLLGLLFWVSLKARKQYFSQPAPFALGQVSDNSKVALKANTNMGEEWFHRLTEKLFVQEEIFLNPQLDLTKLAKAYGISKQNLSQLCRDNLDKNINELINHYRVAYVLKCFEEKQHDQYNILSIGYSAGFSSKSTFYRVFKQIMGLTPTEFLNQRAIG